MKYFLLTMYCLYTPLSAFASVMLTDCDDKPYDVIVRNNGSERMVAVSRGGGEIEEFGPISGISFQIKEKDAKKMEPPMVPLSPYEEFCIWSGKIKVQRLNTGGEGAGASGGILR